MQVTTPSATTMVNGPPTPPPTSAIELSDAAKLAGPSEPEAAAPNANPAPDAPPSHPDCYQSTLPTITDLVAQGDYISAIQTCERCDLNVRYSGYIYTRETLELKRLCLLRETEILVQLVSSLLRRLLSHI